MVLYFYKEPPVADLEKEMKTVFVPVSNFNSEKQTPWVHSDQPELKLTFLDVFKTIDNNYLGSSFSYENQTWFLFQLSSLIIGTGSNGFLVLITSKTGMYKLVPPNTRRYFS
jgi:hypothetical protein